MKTILPTQKVLYGFLLLSITFIISCGTSQKVMELPVIMDDPFVNFDSTRQKNMYQLMHLSDISLHNHG